jgi:hypothetical protein
VEDLLTTEACTMPTLERPARLAELDALFAASARRVTGDGQQVRIHLEGDSTLHERVCDLAERESACCSFFTFGIHRADDGVMLDIAVPEERHEILEALADRVERLSR